MPGFRCLLDCIEEVVLLVFRAEFTALVCWRMMTLSKGATSDLEMIPDIICSTYAAEYLL